jgi:iron complex outermembrane receptor protein
MGWATPATPDYRTLNRYVYCPHEKADYLVVDTQVLGKFGTGPVAHELLAGFDYSHNKVESQTLWGTVGTIDAFNPVYGSPVTLFPPGAPTISKQDLFGLYAQDRLRFEHWLLTVGLRQDFLRTRAHTAAAGEKAGDDRFTARAGLTYLFDNGIAPYVSWSTSFKASDIGQKARDGSLFKPEEGQVFEAGVKYQPKGVNALFTLAAFEAAQKNMLTPDPGDWTYSVQQGRQRSRGFEFEARCEPLANLNLIAAYTYTDAKVTESNDPDELDRRPILVPLNQVSLWADYTLAGGPLANLSFGAGLRYNSSVYGDKYNRNAAGAATLWDAMIRYAFAQNWTAQVNASNLFNKRYVAAADGMTNWAYYANPRVVTASLFYRF